MSLKGKTLFITGASRGIGREIALKAAQDGANIVIAAKSVEEHPKMGGSIYTVAKEVEEAGGKVTYYDGTPFSIYAPPICASNGLIHGEMLEVLR